MKNLKRKILPLALLALGTGALAGCGQEPTPDPWYVISEKAMDNFLSKIQNDGYTIVGDEQTTSVHDQNMITWFFKEGSTYTDHAAVTINEETKTLATITFQNLFRMYEKLSGMTGTAKTEEEEFRETYNMYVIQIPTNKPVIREDAADLVYASKEAKYKAIINVVKEIYKKGQPILIGTIAIETSELISKLLKEAHIPHEVLNAKNHELLLLLTWLVVVLILNYQMKQEP